MGETITLKNQGRKLPVYVAKPSSEKTKGCVIVVHEVWGLVSHVKDIADRFASEGYLAIAPNLLTKMDITEEIAQKLQEELFDPKRRNQAQPKIRELMAPIHAPDFAEETVSWLRTCFDYAFEQADGRVAITGFCFGGTYSFSLAAAEPRLKAAIPFYGHCDLPAEELKHIKGPILAFYGEKDERLMENLPDLKARMNRAGADFTAQVYPDCGHAFFNDTNPFAYNESAAKDAWDRSLKFLETNLEA